MQEAKLVVTLNSEEIAPYLTSEARRLSLRADIKGFRRGKAPYEVVKKELGMEAIWRGATQRMLEFGLANAVRERKLSTYGQPEVSIKKIDESEFVFEAKVFLLPEVKLGDYSNVKVEQKNIVVEDKEVQEILDDLQKMNKDAEINDTFAAGLGNFNNLDDLKQKIRENIYLEKEEKEKQRQELLLLNQIIERSSFEDLPQKLVGMEIDKMFDDTKRILEQNGVNFEDYLKGLNKSAQDLREGFIEESQRRIKTALLIKAVAQREEISVELEEIKQEISEYIKNSRPTPELKEQVFDIHFLNHVKSVLLSRKVINFLKAYEKK